MKLTPWLMAMAIALPTSATAFDIRFNGFMSIGAGVTLDKDQNYIVDPVNGGAYTNELSFAPGSMIAIQALARVNESLTATAQMIGRGGEDFDTSFEWAYLSYRATDNLELRAGRQRAPLYYYSRFLDLGYGYQWIRPPMETYNLFVTTVEGVSADYRLNLGPVSGTWTGYIGATESYDPVAGSDVHFRRLAGTALDLSLSDFTFRGAYHSAMDTQITRYVDVATDPNEPPNIKAFPLDLPLAFMSAALSYDNGTLFSIVEATRAVNDGDPDYINNRNSVYASTGYRIGSLTPHLTYAVYWEDDNGEPPFPGAPNPGANPVELHSYTAGVRWDFDIAAALKLEYTHRQDHTEVPLPHFGDADVISVAIDVVF